MAADDTRSVGIITAYSAQIPFAAVFLKHYHRIFFKGHIHLIFIAHDIQHRISAVYVHCIKLHTVLQIFVAILICCVGKVHETIVYFHIASALYASAFVIMRLGAELVPERSEVRFVEYDFVFHALNFGNERIVIELGLSAD